MKILFAASEGVPFAKTGGLADVAGALSEALAAQRHTVRLVLPFYREIRDTFPKISFTGRTAFVPVGGTMERVEIWEADLKPQFKVWFIGSSTFFDRPGIYGATPGTSYADNDRRFIYFSRAVFEAAKASDFQPDIIHAHDWQTGLTMANLKLIYNTDPFFEKTAGVFSIHNMGYQGNFPPSSFGLTGLPVHAYQPEEIEFYGQVSFLKAGLIYADAVNTVSPTYAKEIQADPVFGMGMEGVLRSRASAFRGILNGLDVRYWNPQSDPNLAARFGRETLEKRRACKADLQRASGLPVDDEAPLLGFIGRMDRQKGIDFILDAAPAVLKESAQIVTLGQGNPAYVTALQKLAKEYPHQVFVKTAFAEGFAHKIYGGADMFLMPSRYEPCGLGQMIAMRYGAPPIVTPTGGLLDTVTDSVRARKGTGFVAADMTSEAYLASVMDAVGAWENNENWLNIQRRGMEQDFSWKTSVKSYEEMYESVAN